MADLNEQTLRTELQEAAKGRPAIMEKLREIHAGALKGTLKSEVQKGRLNSVTSLDTRLETVQGEIKRLGSLLPFLRDGHTKAYIEQLKLLETSLKAEADVIARHAAELGEVLAPEKVQDIVNEVRGAAKAAHAEGVNALLGEFTTFKTAFTTATEHLVKLAQDRADLHVDLAKLVGSEEAEKIMASVKEGTIDLKNLEAPVAEQVGKAVHNQSQIARITEDRNALLRFAGKIESNAKLMGEYSAHIDTELSKAKSAIATIEGDIPGRLKAVDSIRAQEASKAAAKAADTAKQAENALVNKFNGEYKAVGKELIDAGKVKKLHEAELIKLVGPERAKELSTSIYTHGNQLEIFSKESPEVTAVLKQMIAHKPVLDGLNLRLEAVHTAVKEALPAARAQQVIDHHAGKIATAVEGFGGGVTGKATETFKAGKSAAQAAEAAAAKEKLIGTHMSGLFDGHLKLGEAQKDYETARDALKPKLLEAYNAALTKVPEEVTGIAREKAAWNSVKAKNGLANAFKSDIATVTGKLGIAENIESSIVRLEGLVVDAAHGKEPKEVVALVAKVEELASVAAHEHVKPEQLAEIRTGLSGINAFDSAHATLIKLSNDTHGLITKAVEALGKGEKLAGDVAKEGKGNMKWIIGGAVGAAVVGGLTLLSGDKPRQKYTDRLNEQQGPVARGA